MHKKKMKIGVLMGGPSAEHEVSLSSGKNILKALRKRGYQTFPLLLTKQKKLFHGKNELLFPESLKKFDILFIALHGTFGEDGQIQTLLEKMHVAYTGSNGRASLLGIDKWSCQKLFQKLHISVPPSQLIKRKSQKIKRAVPLVVKPRASGSSDGVSIAKSDKELKKSIDALLERGDEVIVQEYIQGREFSCGVLQKMGRAIALPVIEIKPKNKDSFFDYRAKYTKGASEDTVPARIPKFLSQKIQRAALRAHKAIGCRAYSRSDFLMKDGEVYILEINTLPGMTETSLLPQEAVAAGISFPVLVETILISSLKTK